MVGAHAYLLVRIESHTDVTVAYLLMVAQPAHSLYNLSDAGLIVSSQQRRAVSDDEVFSHVLQQLRELLWRRDSLYSLVSYFLYTQQNVRAVVLANNLRLDVGTRAVGTSIVV